MATLLQKHRTAFLELQYDLSDWADVQFCSFFRSPALRQVFDQALNRSPERVLMPLNTCPGIVLVGTPMQ